MKDAPSQVMLATLCCYLAKLSIVEVKQSAADKWAVLTFHLARLNSNNTATYLQGNSVTTAKTPAHNRTQGRVAPPVCSCRPVRWREEPLQTTSAGRQRISDGGKDRKDGDKGRSGGEKTGRQTV